MDLEQRRMNQQGRDCIKQLRVINDTAERSIKLY